MHQATLRCLAVLLMLAPLLAASRSAPGDIQFEREVSDQAGQESYPPSIFEHWRHRIHYRCDACHNSLFTMEAGATEVSMDLIDEGKVCGACHNGEVAFPVTFQNCGLCHVSDED